MSRPNSTKVKLEDVVKALEKSKGMIYHAAKSLGISAKTLYTYSQKYPEVAAALEEHRGRMVDAGEIALEKAVDRGEGWAVCFLLKTLGKDRGYVERQEITGKDGDKLQIEVNYVNVPLPHENQD